MGPAGQREPWLLSCCLSSGASLPYFLGALWAPRLTGTAASTWPHSPSALGPPTASRGCPLPPTGPRLVHPFRCLEAERPWQCLEPSQPSERGQGWQRGDPRATGVALRLTPPPGPRGCSRVQGCLAFWKLSLGLLGRDPAQTEGDKPSFCRLEPEGREPPLERAPENAEGPAEERLLARPVLPAPHVRGGQKHQSTSLQLGIAGSVGTGPLPAPCPRSHCFCPLRDAQRAWSAGVCGSDLLETSSPGSPSLGGRLPKPSTGAQGHCIAVPRGFLLTPTEQPFSSRGQ